MPPYNYAGIFNNRTAAELEREIGAKEGMEMFAKWPSLVVAFGLGLAIVLVGAPVLERSFCVFPSDPEAVIDAKRDLGARGDGVHDDTEALQRGIWLSSGHGTNRTKVLYLPNGVYRVTRKLIVNFPENHSGIGPWIYGQSRDGVVIRLQDGAKADAVLQTHPRDQNPGSADWFMRTIVNLTVDVGNNPNTDGIRFFSNNTGLIKNVRVRGRGRIGINASWMELNGPCLIQDTVVEGFEIGVSAGGQGGPALWGLTLSRVTIRNCRSIGLEVRSNCVAAEALQVENTPLPVVCDLPPNTNWFWWGGVLAMVRGRFLNGDRNGPAILNRSVLYARDIFATGFKMAIQSDTPNGSVEGLKVSEYCSHPIRRLFENAKPFAIKLPIKREPNIVWETDPRKWICANDFGAVAGDNRDDTAAVQRAIDEAAKRGATVVYLRGIGGSDPNWYTLEGEVHVRAPVRHIIGLGFGRIVGNGKFIVDDKSAPVVKFENLQAFGRQPPIVENCSRNRIVVVESCDLRVLGTGKGEIFITNCPSHVELRGKGQSLWARQLNPEGDSDVGLVRNYGGNLWILGMKCEGRGVRVLTANGGKTEVFGHFNYSPDIAADDMRPLYDVDNASLCVMGLREISFGRVYNVKVRERRSGEVREYRLKPGEHGWIGWALFSGW